MMEQNTHALIYHYHRGKCCCDDCVISSAAQVMDIAGSDVSCAAYSPDAEESMYYSHC